MSIDYNYIISDFREQLSAGEVELTKFGLLLQEKYRLDYNQYLKLVGELFIIVPTSPKTLRLKADGRKSKSEDFPGKIQTVSLNEILLIKDFQARDYVDMDIVQQYAEMLEISEPPLIDLWYGEDKAGLTAYYLLSGHHRIEAFRKVGRETTEAVVYSFSYEEAIAFANTSNLTNSIHRMRSNEVRKACVSFLRIADQLSPQVQEAFIKRACELTGQKKSWKTITDTAVGAMFGFSRSSIHNMRREAEFANYLQALDLVDVPLKELSTHRVECTLNRETLYGSVESVNLARQAIQVRWDIKRARLSHEVGLKDSTPKLSELSKSQVPQTVPELVEGRLVWIAGEGIGILFREPDERVYNCYSDFDIVKGLPEWSGWVVIFRETLKQRALTDYPVNTVDILDETETVPSPAERLRFLDDLALHDKLANFCRTAIRQLERGEEVSFAPKFEKKASVGTVNVPPPDELSPPESFDEREQRVRRMLKVGDDEQLFPDVDRNDAPSEATEVNPDVITRKRLAEAIALLRGNCNLLTAAQLIELRAIAHNEERLRANL